MTKLSPRVDLALRDEVRRDLATLSDDAVAGLDELAAWLGEDEAGLRRFVAAGVLKLTDSGEYLLKASIEAYCGYWEQVLADQDAEADADLAAIEPHGSA
jgi:hypothetical protein